MRRTGFAALILIALMGLTVAALVMLDPLRGVGSPAATSLSSPSDPGPASSLPGAPPGGLELDVVRTGTGPQIAIAADYEEATADVAQSKLWFHDGFWWGAIVAERTAELRIHRLDWTAGQWIDTGVPITARASVLPDVVASGDQVWIATGGGEARPQRSASLFRYTYDSEHARYVLDADFPVTIALEQPLSLTLARDAQGRLWAAWIQSDRIVVSRTDGNDLIWLEAKVPPVPDTDVAVDAVTVVPYGETVALLWSNQDRDAVYMAVPMLDESEHWDHEEVVVDGLRQADDHVHAVVEPTSAGPRLYVVVRSSRAAEANVNPDEPQVLLLTREPEGTWEQYLVGRVRDRHTRPIVVLDAENGVLYVVATSPSGGGQIYYKATRVDDIAFAPGVGTLLIQEPLGPTLNNATSTKQLLGSDTGLVVLASDAVTGRYFHVAARLAGASAPSLAVPSTEPAPVWLVNDTFDPYPPTSPLVGRWDLRSTGSANFTIEDVAGDRRVAQAASTGDESRVRMCKEFTAVGSGVVRVEAEVLIPRVGTSDATLTSIRHTGVESVIVSFDDRGVFSFFDGATQVRTVIPYAVGTWYRSIVTLDVSSGTYDWEVRRSSDGALVLQLKGASTRVVPEGPATTVCLQSPDSLVPGPTFVVDGVRVSQ